MKKLVLIDGNSLLNRAFYAMSVFSTRDGLPTNGIFGFVKLIFKIIEDEKPEYMAVAFDVHAPTFRHKLYDQYKGTRKPMPEELVVQVPVLKDLLRAMKIRTVEKEGYEADDLIGTLSCAFDVYSLIYTGDRDSYQLVGEKTGVCFTRRGVSDLNRLTAENFAAQEGIAPEQIVEEKALMGDSSDNIPGVRGVGPKTAKALLIRYGDLDGVYAHLDEIKGSLREKLEQNRDSAYLSRTLATIDRRVPLDVTLESCKLSVPFDEEAREFFARLEFRSLVDSPLFSSERKASVETVVCTDFSPLEKALADADEFVFCEVNGYHIFCNQTEFIFPLHGDILSPGFYAEEMKPLLLRLFTGKKRAIVPDIKATAHWLDGMGIPFTCPAEDVTLLRYLCDSNTRAATASELAKDYALGEDNCAYAVRKAYDEATERMKGTEEEKLYRELELPLVWILFDMERTGVRVQTDKFPEFSEKYGAELKELSEKIYALAGGTRFNINSPAQLSDVLFGRMGLKTYGAKKNAKGGYSTNADVLEKMAQHHEIARLILRYREIQKLQSTYIDGIRPLVSGGIVHTTYNQTATTTGRLSSANPNLQNIPVRRVEGRELRKLFVAREGNVLVDADYSQIELRLLAHFSGCKALVEAYNNGEDIHALTASQVFGVKRSDVTSEMRRRAKAVNFGIIYGISAFGLAKDLSIPQSDAAEYIEKYFRHYADVKEYMEENVRKAKADGYVTTILGRKRYIPELKSSNYNMRAFGERAAMNMPLQGSSADIIKLAMVHVAECLKKGGMKTKMIMQVHDELVLDAPKDEAEAAAALLKEEMEGAVSLRVPLTAEVSTGVSWYDAK